MSPTRETPSPFLLELKRTGATTGSPMMPMAVEGAAGKGASARWSSDSPIRSNYESRREIARGQPCEEALVSPHLCREGGRRKLREEKRALVPTSLKGAESEKELELAIAFEHRVNPGDIA